MAANETIFGESLATKVLDLWVLGWCDLAPEMLVKVTLESQLATTILSRYPTAASFRDASVKKLAGIAYDGSHKIGQNSPAL